MDDTEKRVAHAIRREHRAIYPSGACSQEAALRIARVALAEAGKPSDATRAEPVMAFNLPEGTFAMFIEDGNITTTGTLTPSEGASEFFEQVGQHVLDYIRRNRN